LLQPLETLLTVMNCQKNITTAAQTTHLY